MSMAEPKEEPPKIIFKRKIIFSSGTHRVSIPLEIVEALDLEPGEEVHCYIEGRRKIVFELPKE